MHISCVCPFWRPGQACPAAIESYAIMTISGRKSACFSLVRWQILFAEQSRAVQANLDPGTKASATALRRIAELAGHCSAELFKPI